MLRHILLLFYGQSCLHNVELFRRDLPTNQTHTAGFVLIFNMLIRRSIFTCEQFKKNLVAETTFSLRVCQFLNDLISLGVFLHHTYGLCQTMVYAIVCGLTTSNWHYLLLTVKHEELFLYFLFIFSRLKCTIKHTYVHIRCTYRDTYIHM